MRKASEKEKGNAKGTAKGRWLRLYEEVIDDPKILALPKSLRWPWIALLCIASKHGGLLPDMEHTALLLRVSKRNAADLVARLHEAGLLDAKGDSFEPHNWNGRQYKSDQGDHTAAQRMRKFRSKLNSGVTVAQRNGSVTALRPESESETESEQVGLLVGAEATDQPTDPPTFQIDEKAEGDLRAEIAQLFAAAGRPPVDTKRVSMWLAQGYDAALVRGVIAARMSRKGAITTLRYFDDALREAAGVRAGDHAPVSTSTPRNATQPGPAPEWEIEQAVAFYARTQVWSRHAGPEPGQIGCRASAGLLARFGLAPDGTRLAQDCTDTDSNDADSNDGGQA
jgi:hypothetical protein